MKDKRGRSSQVCRLREHPIHRYPRYTAFHAWGNAIKLSGRTFLAPHRGSCPKGLCKRTGFLGVKRRENPVRRHFERSEMRGLRSGIACKCWNIDSIGLFNIARYTASMPLLPSALPPKGKARRYVANDFLNLIAFPAWGRLRYENTAISFSPHFLDFSILFSYRLRS